MVSKVVSSIEYFPEYRYRAENFSIVTTLQERAAMTDYTFTNYVYKRTKTKRKNYSLRQGFMSERCLGLFEILPPNVLKICYLRKARRSKVRVTVHLFD